ncbi:MAG: MCD, Malonyl-CoA decarboxylase MCD [Hyphomicrobiales bacterium]|nr:MAG: MCD, Malonyl-CoA decarboxylase MCD [Hyphomicrobiales bacterium]
MKRANREGKSVVTPSNYLQDLLSTIADQGRNLLPKALRSVHPAEDIRELSEALLSVRGEASGVAIATEVLGLYGRLSAEERIDYLRYLAETMQPDPAKVKEAAEAYLAAPDERALKALRAAAEGPRQGFFRRLNLAPGATASIVAMRVDLLNARDKALAGVDSDLMHLLTSWFNRGFLVLRRIDWQTPAAILEKIIAYEAVHEIQGWDDLRRRLDPADRRCYAFFHPSLVDEPLIFVEVALMRAIPDNIHSLLREAPKDAEAVEPNTAVFYSISNCQDGLRGISFGNFLIKQVVEDLVKECASLKTFVTLSPVPGFADWLEGVRAAKDESLLDTEDLEALELLQDPDWWVDGEDAARLKPLLMRLAAHYFLNAKASDGKPVDPVARFHLGNGARLDRINWQGDTSAKGLREAQGLMCNYRYELRDIEKNHEAYANEGEVAASRQVYTLVRAERGRGKADFLAIPGLRTARLPKPVKDGAD